MLEKDNKKLWQSLRRTKNGVRRVSTQLFRELEYAIRGPMNIQMISDIQNLLLDYQIIVVDRRTQLKLFAGSEKSKKIILEYCSPPHFNVITSIAGYLECNNFCTRCWVKTNERVHSCQGCCKKCHSISICPITEEELVCENCNIDFYSRSCYDKHIANDYCGVNKKCEKCWVIYREDDLYDHECDRYLCNNCGCRYKASPHYCYIKQVNMEKIIEEDSRNSILICYDIESMQISSSNPITSNGELLHVPNLLISQTVCNLCINETILQRNDDSSVCEFCGVYEHIWFGQDCVNSFCDYLYKEMIPKTARESRDDSISIKVIAHNQRGYDGHFIMQDFFARKFQLIPSVIMSGSKILYSKMENIKFIDSLSLFMQPLASLCKSFNIAELKKGFFPHKFNTPDTQNYVGPYPPIEYYEPEYMKPQQKEEFEKWYHEETVSNPTFDFKKEIIEYCRSDVQILLTAMLKFTQLFKNITAINPITRAFTLASVAMEVFRARMLPRFTLGITPLAGYAERKQSMKANAWLDFMQRNLRTSIRREWRLGPFYADGFIPSTKTVLEFYGCYYHGCPQCYPDRTATVTLNNEEVNVDTLYKAVLLKQSYYQHRKFAVREIWEHDFDTREEYVQSRLAHYYAIKCVGSINIRESFYGGRTNNIKFYHRCAEDEVIRYLDFTSLYPFVLRQYKYPLGHPCLIEENFKDVNQYFGFIKCKVLPPKNLNIAALPMRYNKKLLFPLCRTCALHSNPNSCTHDDDERYLVSTWTSIEVQEAVKCGYKVLKIYQVLHYYQRNQPSIFSDYIKMWLKIKQESSGWPSWVQNDDQKKLYIEQYQTAEGVLLDKASIEKNPGKRSIAKLMLNSFWGKLAQNANLPKTSFVRSYAYLWQILNDADNDILGLHEVSDEIIMVQHRLVEEATDKISPGKTNIAVASFVTAYARLELFRLIQRIESHRQGRVLYFDTDSVVFIEKQGDPEIKCGDYLGELTDEIEAGWKCNLFATLGPKNYAYQVVNANNETKSTIKVKGIRLTSGTLDIISIEKILSMASEYVLGNQQVIKVNQSNITANKVTHGVKTRVFEKIYRAVSEKRRIIGNDTRPFGYVDV